MAKKKDTDVEKPEPEVQRDSRLDSEFSIRNALNNLVMASEQAHMPKVDHVNCQNDGQLLGLFIDDRFKQKPSE